MTHLNKWLDFAPTEQLLSSHAFGHFPWVALDTGDYSMRIWSVLGALVQLFENDDLLAGLAALQDDCNLENIQDQFVAKILIDYVYFSWLVYLREKVRHDY